ncbi:MAG: hemolysin D, partial [Rubripirellula sp.]
MSLPKSLFIDSATLPIRMRYRPDLSFRTHRYLGETYWVIKDPLSVRFYRLTEEEYLILKLLDGKVSLVEIQRRLSERFPHKSIQPKQIQMMLGSLHRSGLTLSSSAEQGEQLY